MGVIPPLWSHQIAALEFARRREGVMLAMEMGTGKTRTAIELARGCETILVACPLSVAPVWKREFETYAPETSIVMVDRGKNSDRALIASGGIDFARAVHVPVVVVINHESLWREPFGLFARGMKWDLIVIDECHRAKAPGGRFSRYLDVLRRSQPDARRLGLTGTPMPHSPLDLYAQMRFIDPSLFGTSFVRFRLRYAVMGGYQQHEVVGYQNTDELMERFGRVAFQAKKQDVLDLPPEVDVEIPVALEGTTMQLYERFERDFYAEVAEGSITATNALVKLLRLQQITSGVLKLDDGTILSSSDAKEGVLEDLLADLSEPVVVFGRFVADLDAVARVCARLGKVYGEVSGRRKDLDAGRYPSGKDVLGVQIQAGGVGIDLSAASVGVFLSTGFSLGDYLQARSRLHRPGQRNKVTFVHLNAVNTIDVKVFWALKHRLQVVEELLKKGREAA